jgi:hypothetical protein
VEAICFADTRGSQVEIVQNIGRALRPNLDGTTKVARIIVPIFLAAGEDPVDMVASASYKPLVAVLQGLRSHDERLVEQLTGVAAAEYPAAVVPVVGVAYQRGGVGDGEGLASGELLRPGLDALGRGGRLRVVGRSHVESVVVDGQDEPVSIRLGVFLSNTKSRRDKLTEPQRTALTQLGIDWA